MNLSKKALLGAVGAAVGLFGFIYSGLFDVSATIPHNRFVAWVLSTTMHSSVERRAREIEVPEFDDEMRLAGINDFAAMCSGCHGAPGHKPEATGLGLNPSAPDLAKVAMHRSAAEIFWVTRHGIRMTGMPGWGITHDDEELWPVVAFTLILPTLDRESYNAMLARADGAGHHSLAIDESHVHDDPIQSAQAHEISSRQPDSDPSPEETRSQPRTQDRIDSVEDHSRHKHGH